ncbi:MAG: hypothetical protein MRJ66_03045 [Nitrospira sp.]|nr:hypothetical protein [Nitrospira sp.]MDR4470245.1 hypothetical protein [Nitrospira sp.]
MQTWLRSCYLITAATLLVDSPITFASPLDQLTDLTGKTHVTVTLKGRDNFTSEYRYDVSVKNLSPDTLIADSLMIVLDKIINLAGEDREGLTGESFLKRFDILDQDGHTEDGKPFFQIRAGNVPDLLPQAVSSPASIRIRNRDYVAVFTPVFKVLGQKRPPPEAKRTDSSTTTTSPAKTSPPAANQKTLETLIQLLIKKGVVTEEEWKKATKP